MDALKSLIQPLVGGAGGSSVVDGMKLVVLGGTVETARRVSSSAWSHFVNSFFLTAHFSEEDYPYDWLMLWLSRRPEWQRSREFETTTRSSGIGTDSANSFGEEDFNDDVPAPPPPADDDDDVPGKVTTRVVFQPTFDTTHTIYYRGHWLRVRRGRKTDGSGTEVLSISVVARSNTILKQLVLQAKKEYEAEAIHRIQIYFADSHGSWRWTDSRHKRPMGSIVLNPGVKEMLLNDTKDFLKSEKWYADRGIPFRRGYLLHGVPGSGKSSLIHAIAGQLMLDIYVVSLSASWISDSTLTTLMGRVPARCILLLEDLDAAFVRSSTREGGNEEKEKKEGPPEQAQQHHGGGGIRGGRSRRDNQLSDVNTLSLSGLLNALDGVAAAEGRLLFATTNHLDRLDPALSRPGRMDVWVEFKNASKWQAEALAEGDVVPPAPSNSSSSLGQDSGSRPASTLWSMSPSFSSSSVSSSFSSTPFSSPTPSSPMAGAAPLFPTAPTSMTATPLPQFGASNTAYLPPPVEEHILSSQHSAKPLDAVTLGILAKKFADGVPEEEFSVAALQGYLLKNKSQPEAAATGVVEWVVAERDMRERLKREKEEREEKERIEVRLRPLFVVSMFMLVQQREKRKQKAVEKEAEKKELEKKEQELEKMRLFLAEKEKEEKEKKEQEKDSEKEKVEDQKMKEAKAAADEEARKEEIKKKELEIEEARKKQQQEEEEESDSDSEDSESENIPIQTAKKPAWT
ncbi:P-loop containing nucleoside triphosphate hydrolase protein [Lyophyllum atratum]|nr:P-loop containing nucleoside triphosphate hydrolase protein [Lyophyllum atratum]